MAEKDEKKRSFDKFKERVYRNIGLIESLDESLNDKSPKSSNIGCLALLIDPFLGNIMSFANKKAREQMKFQELSLKADKILDRKEIQDLICANLDATVNLPVDAAYKITPVLYDLAMKDEKEIPVDSMLFAIICHKITKKGVHKLCP
jgi:hypothetical protein